MWRTQLCTYQQGAFTFSQMTTTLDFDGETTGNTTLLQSGLGEFKVI